MFVRLITFVFFLAFVLPNKSYSSNELVSLANSPNSILRCIEIFAKNKIDSNHEDNRFFYQKIGLNYTLLHNQFNSYLILQQREIVPDLSGNLNFKEVLGPIVVLRAESGEKISDWSTIQNDVSEKLNTLGFTGARITTNFIPSKTEPLIVGTVQMNSDTQIIYSYNYLTRETSAAEINMKSTIVQTLTISGDRFAVLSEGNKEQPRNHWVFDIKTKNLYNFQTPSSTSLNMSSDGKRILVSQRDYVKSEDKSGWVQINKVFELESLKSKGEVLAPEGQSSFIGLILAHSENFDSIAVDETSGAAVWDSKHSDYSVLPKLKIIRYSQKGIKKSYLPGWTQISNEIQEARRKNIKIEYSTMEGLITPDGRYFTLHLPMIERAQIENSSGDKLKLESTHNLVLYWDLKSKSLPEKILSSDLDKGGGLSEPQLQNSAYAISNDGRWSRQFKVGLSNFGKLTIARVLFINQRTNPNPPMDFKVLEVSPQLNGSLLYQSYATTVDPGDPKLDRSNGRGPLPEIFKFQINPAGPLFLMESLRLGVFTLSLTPYDP